ncbi:MAG: hypothetical protein E6Q78_10555 [Rhodoferax sp.]|nr:MAG: hypothetical protein E6Q78_10555 [Rhodoferax sp.]
MKSFVIKHPPKGRTTCSLVRQYYDRSTRRTATKYLGSFPISTNPSKLPSGVNLRPGVMLSQDEWHEIQRFLSRYSTFGIPVPLTEEQLAQAWSQLRSEKEFREQSALDILASTVLEAAGELRSEVANLRAQGWTLSTGMLQFTGVKRVVEGTPLDQLKVRVNVIRQAFREFEETLGEVRLVKTRSPKK